jgi:hypothetical protein
MQFIAEYAASLGTWALAVHTQQCLGVLAILLEVFRCFPQSAQAILKLGPIASLHILCSSKEAIQSTLYGLTGRDRRYINAGCFKKSFRIVLHMSKMLDGE